ncbi:MAG: oligoendopeptidase F [Clostridiales bacterium]|nr:MAG: oligoendopeptidase F [Clostridiales bacterium]
MQVQKRSEIEEKYKWKLEDIFASDADWEAEFAQAEALLPQLEAQKECITRDTQSMLAGLKLIDQASLLLERLYVYARMRRDEDGANSFYQGLSSRAQSLAVKMSGALAFLEPLLLSLDEQTMQRYIEAPELAEYSFMLQNLQRSRKHVLDEQSERLLSMAGDFSDGAQEIFTMLNNADLKFGSVEHNGQVYELTHAKYIELMQSEDRALREKVYRKFYEAFSGHINTIAATYNTAVKKDIFYARARGYESALHKALFADNVPPEVYHDLIQAVHDNLDTMHEYVKLRGELLKIGDLQMYDIYAPLVSEADVSYSYEQAHQLVLDALGALGEDYTALIQKAYREGWIDVWETPGKRSGAYSWGVYGTHPYVLLNHRADLDSVFTLAHELGHAMHTYYSDQAQPYSTAGYAIFVAEVASTVNEILLTRYLLRTVEDKKVRRYILNHYIDQFRTTVLRQTMFAEFEMKAHTLAEQGEALTVESLNHLYLELNRQYHGKYMGEDETIQYEWARIPHFYTAFYVYKYATGFSCAAAIVRKLETEPGMLEKYKRFLSAGGSNYPLEILKEAEIDVGEAVQLCMREFREALEEFRALAE